MKSMQRLPKTKKWPQRNGTKELRIKSTYGSLLNQGYGEVFSQFYAETDFCHLCEHWNHDYMSDFMADIEDTIVRRRRRDSSDDDSDLYTERSKRSKRVESMFSLVVENPGRQKL